MTVETLIEAARRKGKPISSASFAAVVDANVIIDLYSVHSFRDPDAFKKNRAGRAIDALLAGICLHERRSTTYSTLEALRIIYQRVPPGGRSAELLFASGVSQFVKDVVLCEWDARADADRDPRGGEADSLLLTKAQALGLPLITSDGPLAKKASAVGVEVWKPGEYWQRNLRDPEASKRRFLARFQAEAPRWLRAPGREAEWAKMLPQFYDLYRYMLLGRRAPRP